MIVVGGASGILYIIHFLALDFARRVDMTAFVVALIHYDQGSDSDDKSSFFHCEIDDAIQYINLGYGGQAPKNNYFMVHFFLILCCF
jgi:hypothetical protein